LPRAGASLPIQLESQPSGADAKTSLGPGCETACSVSVPARDGGFSVSYSLAKYQPATVQVKVIRNPGDLTTPASTTTDPNPVFAKLQPAGPPHKVMRPKKSKQPPAGRQAVDRVAALPSFGRLSADHVMLRLAACNWCGCRSVSLLE